jgi:hypothetical protein
MTGQFGSGRIIQSASFSKKAIMEIGEVPSTNSRHAEITRHRFFVRQRRLHRFRRPFEGQPFTE